MATGLREGFLKRKKSKHEDPIENLEGFDIITNQRILEIKLRVPFLNDPFVYT